MSNVFCLFCKKPLKSQRSLSYHQTRCKNYRNFVKIKEENIDVELLIKQYNDGNSLNYLKDVFAVSRKFLETTLKNNYINLRTIHDCKTPTVLKKQEENSIKHRGYKNNFQSPTTKETVIEKYGIENVFQSEKIKEKIRKTNLEKYGIEYPQQSKNIQDKLIKTCLEKYGVENVFQSEKIKEKIRKTNLEKYGGMGFQRNGFRKHVDKICLEKYGKTSNQIGLEHVLKSKFSKPHKNVCKILDEINVQYINEFKIGNFFADIKITNCNSIIEIYGDYWHANPKFYNFYDSIKLPGNVKHVSDIWESDYNRLKYICNTHNVIVLWEYDIKNNSKNVKDLLNEHFNN